MAPHPVQCLVQKYVCVVCSTVFGMLLGDTLILDDLDCANKYRQEVSMVALTSFCVFAVNI